MLALVAAQILVFNHVHIYGYTTPLPFVYLLLLFPLGTERWNILLWGFVCGLLCDITSLTLGVGMAAMTLVAFIQPPLLQLMLPKDAVEEMQPGYDTMGFWGYFRYALLLTFIFMLSSWLLTFIFVLAIEAMRYKL